MKYKDVLRLRFPNHVVLKFLDDTYEGILWSPLNQISPPTKEELDLAMIEVSPEENPAALILTVLDHDTREPSDKIVVVPPSMLINNFSYSNVPSISGTSIIHLDNSAPEITEGSQLAEISIIPKSIGSKFKLSFSSTVACNGNNKNLVFAIFRNNVCVGTTFVNVASNKNQQMSIEIVDVPIATQEITYSLRVGSSSSCIWMVNTLPGGASIGGTTSTPFMIMEFE